MKKLIELLKKLLGSSSAPTGEQKGFTLIELIIVIAILGVLAAAVLAAIDPIDKLRAGNDSKVQSDVRAIYDGAQRTAAAGSAAFPANLAAITELRSTPTAPTAAGYSAYTYFITAAGDDAVVCGAVKSKGSLAKSVPVVAAGGTAYFTITGGEACIRNAACAAATVCP